MWVPDPPNKNLTLFEFLIIKLKRDIFPNTHKTLFIFYFTVSQDLFVIAQLISL